MSTKHVLFQHGYDWKKRICIMNEKKNAEPTYIWSVSICDETKFGMNNIILNSCFDI